MVAAPLIDTSRPFEPTGMTTELWAEIEPRPVSLSLLHWSQDSLDLLGLINAAGGEVSYAGDPYPHVVCYRDAYYLSDGHHRAAVALVRGLETIEARVLNV